MAGVAQLVRAPGCGPGGRRFKTGHSPHFLPYFFLHACCLAFFFFGAALRAEEQKVAPKEIDHTKQLKDVSSVIDPNMPIRALHQKPNMVIIIDQFSMRKDISDDILKKLSPQVILCVPCHSIDFQHFVESAKELKFTLAISIDYLNAEKWKEIQVFIEKNSWVKGVVVWSVSSNLNLNKMLVTVKNWLSLRNIWLVYANTNNALPNPDVPVGVFMPDGFVRTDDEARHCTEQADFVCSQAKFKNRGLLFVEPGTQHVEPLVDWILKNIDNLQWDNLSK